MAKAKALTYEELMDYAHKHYNKGGDMTFECWDRKAFDEYVNEFGPITKSVALRMFRVDYDYEKDARGRWC